MKTLISVPQRGNLTACAVLFATVLGLVVLGHNGRRVLQMAVLALPLLVWMLWPVRSAAWHRVRTVAVWGWAMAFAADGVVRAFLLDAYQAAPDGAMVLGAAANSNARESGEYLAANWRSVLVWLGVLAAAGLVCGRFAGRGARMPGSWPRAVTVLVCTAVFLGSLAYASKPWRRLHPVVFWAGWTASVQELRAGWADRQEARDRALAQARAAAPVLTQAGPSTVVLVITDSINRDNMALYGYGRATTPRLLDQKAQLGDALVVVRNAWSVDASTLPALRNFFYFGHPPDDTRAAPEAQAQAPQHLLALARAAGYKVWWMSNHDDVGIEQEHARMADVVEMINRTPGRAGASLDGELLDCVQEALEDPAERKLVVVHLIGAHPHYGLRFPAGDNPFDDSIDSVERGLLRDGRARWVRQFRQEYDAALLYHDFVVAETLQMARRVGSPGGHRAWMYLSDHGQEVGHGEDRAGHSPATASGYRIPALVWRNRAEHPAALEAARLQPFRSDWAGWTLADLLNLQWHGRQPSRNLLDPLYAWQAPRLPVAIGSFRD